MKTKKASTKASPKNIRANFINFLTIAATCPEAVLLVALILSEVAHGR